ncbi:MAG: DUF1836 domain-containing protein [Oscillospiraceae bacterium]|nr:DUF1836 domain-containing protein [Oscillospiraceae bacterium]
MKTEDILLNFHCPRFLELAPVDLYLDQVLYVLNSTLQPLCEDGEPTIITAPMVNNYVKHNLLTPPLRKRYNREQLSALFVICILKRVFSITEIRHLLYTQSLTYPRDVAYDYFCCEFENAIRFTFEADHTSMPFIGQERTTQTDLVRGMVLAVCSKLYVQKILLTQPCNMLTVSAQKEHDAAL